MKKWNAPEIQSLDVKLTASGAQPGNTEYGANPYWAGPDTYISTTPQNVSCYPGWNHTKSDTTVSAS